ncbi:MAG: polysaccharide export protein EpsE [Burkholderiaceae bacterium]
MSSIFAEDMQLGAGDVIKISVYDHPDLLLETRVSEAGSITYPLIGEVSIGGMSSAAAEKKIAGLLENGRFIPNPQVSIIVTLMQSQQVSVLGQVNKPGRYPIDGKRNLTDILALAGGVNPDGSDEITLIRNRDGKTIKELINLIELVRNADTKGNPPLLAGDVVFVERAPRFYIYGEVQHPGSYKLERDMMVVQALSQGGGLTPRGTERGVRIKRRDEKGVLQVIDAKQDDPIKADDIVFVKESLF